MFNKRHYQAIATVMQANCPDTLADMFAVDNALFKYDLFLQACQPGANVRARKVA